MPAVSVYEGTITLRVRFFGSNGHEADENLKDIALEIAQHINAGNVDPDDATMPADACYIAVGQQASPAVRA